MKKSDTQIADTQPRQDADVDLVDIWLALERHKYLLFGAVATVSALGVMSTITTTPSFNYSTAVQVAHIGGAPVEDLAAVVAKLTAVYVPAVTFGSRQDSAADVAVAYDVKVVNPPGSDLVLLETRGDRSLYETVRQLHGDIAGKLAGDHARLVDVSIKNLEADLANQQIQLAGLKDESEFTAARIKALGTDADLLSEQLERARTLFQASQDSRKEASQHISSETKAMTLLLIDNEAQQHYARLQGLEERLYVGLAMQRGQLQKEQADNLRRQETLQARIAEIKSKISGVRSTGVLGPTLQVRAAMAVGKTVRIALAAMLGLFIGLTLVAGAEFLARVKQRRQAGPATV